MSSQFEFPTVATVGSPRKQGGTSSAASSPRKLSSPRKQLGSRNENDGQGIKAVHPPKSKIPAPPAPGFTTPGEAVVKSRVSCLEAGTARQGLRCSHRPQPAATVHRLQSVFSESLPTPSKCTTEETLLSVASQLEAALAKEQEDLEAGTLLGARTSMHALGSACLFAAVQPADFLPPACMQPASSWALPRVARSR